MNASRAATAARTARVDVELTVNLLDENAGLFICFCRDITERKRAEGEILQRTQDLALVNTLNEAANRLKPSSTSSPRKPTACSIAATRRST